MFTCALESSSSLGAVMGAVMGTAPHSATNTIMIPVLTVSVPSMILLQRSLNLAQALHRCRGGMHQFLKQIQDKKYRESSVMGQ